MLEMFTSVDETFLFGINSPEYDRVSVSDSFVIYISLLLAAEPSQPLQAHLQDYTKSSTVNLQQLEILCDLSRPSRHLDQRWSTAGL